MQSDSSIEAQIATQLDNRLNSDFIDCGDNAERCNVFEFQNMDYIMPDSAQQKENLPAESSNAEVN